MEVEVEVIVIFLDREWFSFTDIGSLFPAVQEPYHLRKKRNEPKHDFSGSLVRSQTGREPLWFAPKAITLARTLYQVARADKVVRR